MLKTSGVFSQWNSQNLHSNPDEVIHYLCGAKHDVLCLQSIGRGRNNLPKLPTPPPPAPATASLQCR